MALVTRKRVETALVGFVAFSLGILALIHQGVPAADVDLNDGGVWVTNQNRRLDTKWELGLNGGAVIANPIPEEYSMDSEVINKVITTRSEERSVGKECRSRWSPYH